MNDYPKWPHLENLDRVLRDMPDYLSRPDTSYIVTEKVHGTNARFGRDENGVPWAGSRNLTIAEGDPAGWKRTDHQGFLGFAADLVTTLQPGVTIYGEWAGKGVQKGIDYGDKAFYLFGWSGPFGLGSLDGVRTWATLNGVRMVPVLAMGTQLDLDSLRSLRTKKSELAEQDHEGIVISADPPIVDAYGHVVIAKFKAPAFEERAHAKKELPTPADLATVQAFVDEYATDTRLDHVLQQVSETIHADPDRAMDAARDLEALDPRHTGLVLKAMYEDVVREAGSDYEALSDNDKKVLGKVLNTATKALLAHARDEGMAA